MISSDVPFVSLDDVFTNTTKAFSEVPTTANGSTKNNYIHITGESFAIYFLDFVFYSLNNYLLSTIC